MKVEIEKKECSTYLTTNLEAGTFFCFCNMVDNCYSAFRNKVAVIEPTEVFIISNNRNYIINLSNGDMFRINTIIDNHPDKLPILILHPKDDVLRFYCEI